MTRLTHILLLLLSLAIIVRIGMSGPGALGEGGEPTGKADGQGAVPDKLAFNPETPVDIPDLNEGYVFSQERELSESDFEALNKSADKDREEVDAADLEEVLYSGSIIIGDLRKALVTYPSVEKSVQRDAKGRKRSKGRAVMKHEQLEQGGEFLGFLVASVEEDRIVFEKDGDQVEKFLHDQNKKRIVVKRRAKQKTTRKVPAKGKVNSSAASRTRTTNRRKPEPPKDLPQRRSQRLLRGMMGNSPGNTAISRLMPPPATSGSQ